MKKMALIFMGIGMASVFAGTSAQSADSSCASPKFIQENMCETMSTLSDSARLFVSISLPRTVPDSMNSPAYLAKIKVWSESLFTKYDLRAFQDTMTRLPVPPDSEISWVYNFLIMTKTTALALVNESYVHWLEVRTSPPSTLIYSGNTGPVKREHKPVGVRVDVLGRYFMSTYRSIKSYAEPLPQR